MCRDQGPGLMKPLAVIRTDSTFRSGVKFNFGCLFIKASFNTFMSSHGAMLGKTIYIVESQAV